MPQLYQKSGGVWVPLNYFHMKSGGAWQLCTNAFMKSGGAWQRVWPPTAITYAGPLASLDLPIPTGYHRLRARLVGGGGGASSAKAYASGWSITCFAYGGGADGAGGAATIMWNNGMSAWYARGGNGGNVSPSPNGNCLTTYITGYGWVSAIVPANNGMGGGRYGTPSMSGSPAAPTFTNFDGVDTFRPSYSGSDGGACGHGMVSIATYLGTGGTLAAGGGAGGTQQLAHYVGAHDCSVQGGTGGAGGAPATAGTNGTSAATDCGGWDSVSDSQVATDSTASSYGGGLGLGGGGGTYYSGTCPGGGWPMAAVNGDPGEIVDIDITVTPGDTYRFRAGGGGAGGCGFALQGYPHHPRGAHGGGGGGGGYISNIILSHS